MFEYWFMFPIGVIVATLAMSTLVGGATFFSPLFILVLSLEAHVAIASALMIQFFGFSTGLIRYMFQRAIDYRMGFFLLLITIPYAIIGSFLATKLDPYIIRILLGVIIIWIGKKLLDHNILKIKVNGKNVNINFAQSRHSKFIHLETKELQKNIFQTSLGSIFLGMTSAGLGELLGFNWIKETNTNIKNLVATTVFIIAITTFATSATHIYTLFTTNMQGLYQAFDILIFAVPGVITGAIIGTNIINKINQEILQKIIAFVLILTGILCFIPF